MGTQFLPNSSRRYVLAGAIAALTMTSGVNGLAQNKPAGPAAPQPAAAQSQPAMPRLIVTAGRSTVLTTDFNVTPDRADQSAVADATVVAPREILIDGKAAGTISLIVWGESRRSSTTWSWSSRSRRCSSSCRRCFLVKTSRSAPTRTRSSCRDSLEQRGDAARRRDRQAAGTKATSSTCCRSPAEATASR